MEDFGRVQQFVGRFLEDFGPVLKIHHFGHRSFPIPEGRARIPSFSYVQPGSHFGPLRPVCSDSGTNQQTQASSSLSSPILSHTDMALWDFFFWETAKSHGEKHHLPHFLVAILRCSFSDTSI